MPTQTTKADAKRYHIRSVERALALLQALVNQDSGLTATEISREVQLDPSTTFRMLVTLESQQFVEQDPDTGKYKLGVSCLDLGSQYLKGNDLRHRSIGLMESLRNEFGETVHLTKLDGAEVVYLEKLDGLHPIGLMSSRVGQRNPAHCTGVGKALLAYLSPADLESRFPQHELRRFTGATLTDWSSLLSELRLVRQRGYAVDNEEHELGVKCVAVPIFGHRGILAAMSISGPCSRIDEHIQKGLIEDLKRSGAQLSAQMGGAQWLTGRTESGAAVPTL